MRLLLIRSIGILSWFSVTANAQSVKKEKPLTTISFLSNGYQVLIPLTVNGGKDTLHFLFDSGCEVNVLSSGKAKTLGLTDKDEAGVSGWSKGMIMIPKATARSIQIGSVSVPYPEFYLQELGSAAIDGVPVDGIIGYSLLKTYTIQINYRQKTISFYRNGSRPYPSGGELLSLGLNYKTPTLQAAIALPGGSTLTSTYHLITGGDFGILFNEEYVKKYGLNSKLTATGSVTREDLAGPINYTQCTVPYLELNQYKRPSVPAMYSPKINDNAPDKEIAGAIGALVWQHYTLFINLPRKELYLVPAG